MKRILIIEDDLSILRGLKDILGEEGYEVIAALDGEAGLRLVKEKTMGAGRVRPPNGVGIVWRIRLLQAFSEESLQVLPAAQPGYVRIKTSQQQWPH